MHRPDGDVQEEPCPSRLPTPCSPRGHEGRQALSYSSNVINGQVRDSGFQSLREREAEMRPY